MRRCLCAALLLCMCLMLSGCWDIKSLQDVNYYTGIGIDYANNKYQVYVQQLDFASVAKSEGGKSDKPSIVWVGHAEGDSLSEAIIEMYQTSQQTVFWGHLNSIVLSENLLKYGDLLGVFDSLIRYPEIRYTPWVYGTKKEIKELFTTKPFFNLSPINSILYSPETNYNQRPLIAPMRLSRFIRELREPGQTVLLPSLSVSEHTWDRDNKPDPKLEIDGIFAMHNLAYKHWISYKNTLGIRWLVDKALGSRIIIRQGNEVYAELKLEKPKSKIRVTDAGGEPVFNIEVRVAAAIIEMWKLKSKKEYEQLADQQIAEQIKATHQSGQNNGADLLDLEHVLYRKRFKQWNKLTSGGTIPLKPINLGEIKVSVRIDQSGMYKLKRKMAPY
ncbi:Ger(x)C family spore germination protein [Cohnella cholangitidis]|uniref:Ger(X)C family spore germination protein n=1 Tax=Cohnella cholangitidis TaxID=2598458 RepID=A0A7G5C5Z6_9BACL|nr:Ger(x)C family spore germination protein [Cohnella cholangitidis]QMV44630.1 Ger(x)C family spore germination protein [Cohnella cholangitidis]